MEMNRILVLTDLSAPDGFALQRAGDLAQAHRASLTLACLPGAARQERRLLNVAHQLQESRGVPVRVLPGLPTDSADLIVVSRRSGGGLRAALHGEFHERILRRYDAPLLVVRSLPRTAYRSVVAAVDLEAGSEALAQLAAVMNPIAQIDLLHVIPEAVEGKLREAGVHQEAIGEYRERCARDVRGELQALARAVGVEQRRMMTILATVLHGEVGRQTVHHQGLCGADLVVMGWHRQPRLAELVCPSPALRVVGMATCDVLVVPSDRRARARAQAALARAGAA